MASQISEAEAIVHEFLFAVPKLFSTSSKTVKSSRVQRKLKVEFAIVLKHYITLFLSFTVRPIIGWLEVVSDLSLFAQFTCHTAASYTKLKFYEL